MNQTIELAVFVDAESLARIVVNDFARTYPVSLFHKACDFEHVSRFVDHHVYLDHHPQFRSDYLKTLRESDHARSEFAREYTQTNSLKGDSQLNG
jgi:hypothetical protein